MKIKQSETSPQRMLPELEMTERSLDNWKIAPNKLPRVQPRQEENRNDFKSMEVGKQP